MDVSETRDLRIAQGIIDIPYQFHVVRNGGKGSIAKTMLEENIERLNNLYLNANIRFVSAGPIRYIDNSRFYNFPIHLEDSLANKHDLESTINIYCLNEIRGGYYGYTYHPDKARKNRMFISRSGFENFSTFSHEMGHFFGLYHTHGKGIKSEKRKEPIDRNVDADNNGILDCYESGDDLCDTPADPNLGLEEYRHYCTNNCEILEKIPNQSGDYYEPQITNLMCYNQYSKCRTELTSEQLSRIAKTARNDTKSLRKSRNSAGSKVNGQVVFVKSNGRPMRLSLDINLYRFDKVYYSRDQFSFKVHNGSDQPLHLSIINMDSKRKLYHVFPHKGDIAFLQPNETVNPLEGFITLDEAIGREYICLLFSTYPVDSHRIVNNMTESFGTFSQRLYRVLGRQLLPLDNVHYSEGGSVEFDGILKGTEILPIMLEMDHHG